MLTKKDYEAIAKRLRDAPVHMTCREVFAFRLSELFEEKNPRFDKKRFVDAVRGMKS